MRGRNPRVWRPLLGLAGMIAISICLVVARYGLEGGGGGMGGEAGGGGGGRAVEMEQVREELSDDVITAPIRVFGNILGWAGRRALSHGGATTSADGSGRQWQSRDLGKGHTRTMMVRPDLSTLSLRRVGGKAREDGLKLEFRTPQFKHPTMPGFDHLAPRRHVKSLPTSPHQPYYGYAIPQNPYIGASVRLDPAPCSVEGGEGCDVKAKLEVEVFCPPYAAPDHGWVKYKGVKHTDATAVTPAARKYFSIRGIKLPVAQTGDIPEGERVEIGCNSNHMLAGDGSTWPQCKHTGEFEEGKVCVPIMCDAVQAPRNGYAVPSAGVRAGEVVKVYCDEGYDEVWVDGVSAKADGDGGDIDGDGDGRSPIALHQGGGNAAQEGREMDRRVIFRSQTGNGVENDRVATGRRRSREGGGGRGAGRMMGMQMRDRGRGLVAHPKLARLKRAIEAAKEQERRRRMAKEAEEERERGDRRLAVPIDGSMTSRDVDEEVKRFVMGPGRRLLSSTVLQLAHARAVRCTRSGRYNATLQLTCAKAGGGTAAAKAGGGTAAAPGDDGSLSTRVSGEEESNSTVPRAIIDYPPLNKCPPYPAPPHGSVWYKGVEYKTLTPAGIPESEHVSITCQANYRLSPRGNPSPECLPTGFWTQHQRDQWYWTADPLRWNGDKGATSGYWEQGRVCEPITCQPYPPPLNGRVDVVSSVRAGTRVTVTCNKGYVASGVNDGAKHSPMCLASGEFEKGVACVAGPCPCCESSFDSDSPTVSTVGSNEKTVKCGAPTQPPPPPPYVMPTKEEIRDWEDEVTNPKVFDYIPNVFDHEPRPTTWDTR